MFQGRYAVASPINTYDHNKIPIHSAYLWKRRNISSLPTTLLFQRYSPPVSDPLYHESIVSKRRRCQLLLENFCFVSWDNKCIINTFLHNVRPMFWIIFTINPLLFKQWAFRFFLQIIVYCAEQRENFKKLFKVYFGFLSYIYLDSVIFVTNSIQQFSLINRYYQDQHSIFPTPTEKFVCPYISMIIHWLCLFVLKHFLAIKLFNYLYKVINMLNLNPSHLFTT